MGPPDLGNDDWWARHEQEKQEIARALQTALGKGLAVKLYRRQGWLTIDEIDLLEGGQS